MDLSQRSVARQSLYTCVTGLLGISIILNHAVATSFYFTSLMHACISEEENVGWKGNGVDMANLDVLLHFCSIVIVKIYK